MEKHTFRRIVERFILGRLIATDCYVEPLCRLGGPFVKSALEEVEAGCVRPGGKMEFLSERIGSFCYACCIFDIRCIINGLFCMYKFGTRKTCTWLFGRLVFIEIVFC